VEQLLDYCPESKPEETGHHPVLGDPPRRGYTKLFSGSFGELLHPPPQQIPFLDGLRTIAILLVVNLHFSAGFAELHGNNFYSTLPFVINGWCGVDLFFVLSGWLVGGLYWRERLSFGNVQIVGFWIRRWMRTLPPYFAALLVSWLGVLFLRRQSFDFGYVFFVQNYYTHIPFFLVSWSLCVEEHFYLLTPLLLLAWQRTKKINSAWFIAALVIAPISRFLIYGDDYSLYFKTATHLRMDGLILGLWLSYLAVEEPRCFQRLVHLSRHGIVVGAGLLVFLVFAGGVLEYTLWGTVLALFFSAVLLTVVLRNDLDGPLFRGAFPIALASYSVYLTHAWAVHAALDLTEYVPSLSVVYFPVAFLLVAAFGGVFYYAVERPSIGSRDLVWPRRRGAVSDATEPSAQPVVINAALAANKPQ